MPSNRPVLPSFHARHKNNRPYSKIVNPAPLRVPRTTLRLLERCNNAPFVFVPWKSERSLWFWQMAAVVKPSKYDIAWFPLPFIHLFVLNRRGLQRLFLRKASARFPSRRGRSIFIFSFPKNRERSVTPHILGDAEHLFRYAISLSQAPISPKFRSHTYPSSDALAPLMAMDSSGSKYP